MSNRRTQSLSREFQHSVFPILPVRPHEDGGTRVYCDAGELGSAFFISSHGIFLTARHVVDKWSADSYAVVALHRQLRRKKECRVTNLELHPVLDIAIGMAQKPGEGGWPCPFSLGGSRIGDGSSVLFFGYANTEVTPHREPRGPINLEDSLTINLNPRVHVAHVVEHLERAPLIDGPCYHVTCDPGGGISGGPLIRKRTRSVHALFSAGIPNASDNGTGFATCLSDVLDTWRIPFLDDLTLREFSNRFPQIVRIR